MDVGDSGKATSRDTMPVRLPDDQDVPCPACGYNLRGNTSGTCPECGVQLGLAVITVGSPKRRSITGVLEYVLVGLIALALAFVSAPFMALLLGVLGRVPVYGVELLLPILGVATVMGTMALVSLVVMRPIHFVVTTIFFVLLIVILITNMVSATLSGIRYASAGAAVIGYGVTFGFLLLGVAGLTIEIICERKSKRWTRLR